MRFAGSSRTWGDGMVISGGIQRALAALVVSALLAHADASCAAGEYDANSGTFDAYYYDTSTGAVTGGISCQPCPAGTFAVGGDSLTNSCEGYCAPGYFCPAGSNSASHTICPMGSYSSGTLWASHFV